MVLFLADSELDSTGGAAQLEQSRHSDCPTMPLVRRGLVSFTHLSSCPSSTVLANSLTFVAGIALLLLGADVLVAGATRIAKAMKVSTLVIGLTVVALGTSLPEGAVTVSASLGGSTDVAVGNIVGSNIFNVLLILGIAAVIAPLVVKTQLIKQEVPFMIGISVLLLVLMLDGSLSRVEAGVLFSMAFIYTAVLIFQARRTGVAVSDVEADVADATRFQMIPAPLLVLAGLGMLALGGTWLVDSATFFARALGISELVIGLTVVAIGTSLPEVATCVTAVLKGERDMAVGNVVGSNIFNILLCLGASGLVSPIGLPAPAALLNFDLLVMVAVAMVTFPIFLTGRTVSRWEGWMLLFYCVAYVSYVLLAATHHDALPAFSNAMMLFVIPLTAATLIASMIRDGRSSAS